jgi:hypothetical protein
LPPPETPAPPETPGKPRQRDSENYSSHAEAPSPSAATGYTRAFGFAISPEVVQWIAPACLVLSFLLTFFSWNGAYPGGYGVYTQGAWGALAGSFSTDPVGEKVLQLDPEKPLDKTTARLRDQVHSNWLLLLYLPLIFVTAALAVLFTLYPMLNINIPPNLEQYLPFRMGLITVLALLLFLMLGLQSLNGFGLENALAQRARSEVKVNMPDRPTDEEVKQFEIMEGTQLGKWNVRHTFALRLALLCNVVAAVAAAAMFAMNRHGTEKRWPRLDVSW